MAQRTLQNEKPATKEEKQQSQLFYAIVNDDTERMRQLLQDGVNPNTVFVGSDGLGKPLVWSPLHLCCEKGREECCRLLVSFGASIDDPDRWGQTPLMYTVQIEWSMLLTFFIQNGADLEVAERQGRTALHLAVECSDEKFAKTLLDAGANVDALDIFGRSPLWMAVCEDGREKKVKALLAHGSNANQFEIQGNWTPLQAAIKHAKEDRLTYVQLLLQHGSSVNHRDQYNQSSLYNLILRSCRDLNADQYNDIMPIAKLILEAGFDINGIGHRQKWSQYGGTILKFAADKTASLNIIKFLLAGGANPDIPDHTGGTPLLAATLNGREDVCRELLRYNCKINISGEVKIARLPHLLTPVQCAAYIGHETIVKLLINTGAKLFFTQDCDLSMLEPDCSALIIEAMTAVPRLTQLCRVQYRCYFRLDLSKQVHSAVLPTTVKSYLLMEDVLN